MPDTGNVKDCLELPPTNFSIFTLKNMTSRTYLIIFSVQYCFLFRFVCVELVSLIWFLQFWVAIHVYGTMIKLVHFYTELIIVYHRLWAVKKEKLLVVYVYRVCCGSKNSKNVLFQLIMISLKKSISTWQFLVNKVIKFRPYWELSPLLVITSSKYNTKTPAFIAGTPFPFPHFCAFLPPPSSFPFVPAT